MPIAIGDGRACAILVRYYRSALHYETKDERVWGLRGLVVGGLHEVGFTQITLLNSLLLECCGDSRDECGELQALNICT